MASETVPPPPIVPPPPSYDGAGWERRGTSSREFRVPLALDELLERTQELVDGLRKLDNLGSAMQAARTQYKKEREALDERLGDLRAELEQRARPVKRECSVWMNFASNLVHVVDPTTHLVVEERAITAEERQQVLPDPTPPPPAGEADDVDGPDPALDELALDLDPIDLDSERSRRKGPASLPPEAGSAPPPKRGPQRRRV